jgi:hypothetical protein
VYLRGHNIIVRAEIGIGDHFGCRRWSVAFTIDEKNPYRGQSHENENDDLNASGHIAVL